VLLTHPIPQIALIKLSFTRRSYIFLRNTAIAPLVLVSSMDLELSTQADSMRYIE